MPKVNTVPKNVKVAPRPSKPPEKKQPLAKTGSKALATRINAEEDAGAGQENIKAQDMAIPQLIILQSGSPQVKKSDAAHIKGAEEGMICDPLGERVWSGEENDGITVIPVTYRRSHIEWKDREAGGGFVKDHGPDGAILDQCKEGKKGRPTLPNGNNISVVAEYFVFLIDDDGSAKPYVLRMASTQLKKARRWNTMINQLREPKADGSGTFNPAMFFKSYHLTTVPEANDQGSWFGWKITPGEKTFDLPGGEGIYQSARDFRTQVSSGKVVAHAPQEDHSAGASPADNDAPM